MDFKHELYKDLHDSMYFSLKDTRENDRLVFQKEHR